MMTLYLRNFETPSHLAQLMRKNIQLILGCKEAGEGL